MVYAETDILSGECYLGGWTYVGYYSFRLTGVRNLEVWERRGGDGGYISPVCGVFVSFTRRVKVTAFKSCRNSI